MDLFARDNHHSRSSGYRLGLPVLEEVDKRRQTFGSDADSHAGPACRDMISASQANHNRMAGGRT